MNSFPTHGEADFDGEAEYNVVRGAAWLDQVKPGWADLIDTSILTMCDGNVCVLGQVFADEAKRDDSSNGYDWVFDREGCSFILEHGFVYGVHRDAWISEIFTRRVELESV